MLPYFITRVPLPLAVKAVRGARKVILAQSIINAFNQRLIRLNPS
jgi:hypothetical protein